MLPEGRTSILMYEPQEPLIMLVLRLNITPLMLDVWELDPGGKKV